MDDLVSLSWFAALSETDPLPNRLNNCAASHSGRKMLTAFDSESRLKWPRTNYDATLTTIWAKPR